MSDQFLVQKPWFILIDSPGSFKKIIYISQFGRYGQIFQKKIFFFVPIKISAPIRLKPSIIGWALGSYQVNKPPFRKKKKKQYFPFPGVEKINSQLPKNDDLN